VKPARRLLIGAIVVVGGTIGYPVGRVALLPWERTIQPIAFSHAKHAGDLAIDCTLCHATAGTGAHASLPTLATCLGCHEEAQTDSAEENKIRELAADGKDDVFRKTFRLADHVFYTHQRHVTVAQLPCDTCHGAIAATVEPPERPLKRITMDFCVDCHARSGVTQDCTRCHR